MLVDSRAMAPLRRYRNGLIAFALFATLLMLLAVTLASATTAAAKPAKRVTVTGKLTMVVYERTSKRRSSTAFFVNQRGRRYRISVRRNTVVRGKDVAKIRGAKSKLAALRQTKVLVIGRLRGRTIIATKVVQLAKLRTAALPRRARTVAVVAYYFPEDTAPKYTAAEIRQQVFTGANSVRAFYREDSNNAIDLVGIKSAANGDVFGPYQIPTTATNAGTCKIGVDGALPSQDQWLTDARAAAIAANPGLNLDSYDHVIFLGTHGTCGFFRSNAPIGTTAAPAKESRLYADTPAQIPKVTAHELGHNLGMTHAQSTVCYAGPGWPVVVRVPVSAACNNVEYGDPYSVMGPGYAESEYYVHNHGPHTAMLGFFDTATTWSLANPAAWSSSTPLIEKVYARLPALTFDDSNWDRGNLYSVDRCRDAACTGLPAGDGRRYISLDYRQRVGTFDFNLIGGNLDQGVGVRVGPNPNLANVPLGGTNDFALIDATTATSANTDAVLTANDWIYDPVADMTIRAGAVTTDSNGMAFVTAVLAKGAPTPAQGTVSIVATTSTASRLQFAATAGRQNLLKVNYDSAASAYLVTTIHSDGALAPGSGCTAVDKATVRCPRVASGRTVSSINLDLGDENDIGYVDQTVTVPATITGGAGDDWLVGGRGADTLSAGDGDDGLATGNATNGTDSLSGDAGNDTLWGGTGAESLLGGAGNDTLMPGKGGATTIQGGADFDTVSFLFRSAAVTASLDGVTNDGESGETDNIGDGVSNSVEYMLGSFGNDTLSGSSAANRIDGGAGTDTLEGHGGGDTLLGGGDTVADNLYGENASGTLRGTAGNDKFPQGAANDGGGTIDGGDGTYDQIEYNDRYASLTLTIGNGTLDDGESGEGDNVRASVEAIKLGHADDTVSVSSSAGSTRTFAIFGFDGSDTLRGGPNDDSIYGGFGDDKALAGQGGADYIDGGAGNDAMWGDAPAGVSLIGTAGKDRLLAGAGADTMYGGGGVDKAEYNTMTAPVTVTTDGSANDGLAGEKDNVQSDIEHLVGGSANDSLTGGAAANILEGLAGNDTLGGGDGDDTVNGGDGSDTLNGGNGNDIVYGVAGNDTLTGGAGNDNLDGGDNDDTVSGGDNDDTVNGGAQNDTQSGGNGNDTLLAGSGADVFDGGAGTDMVDYHWQSGALTITIGDGANDGLSNGSEGDDVRATTENVIGASLNDRIVGSSTTNRLEGGAGADTLIGMGAADTLVGGAGADVVWGDAENNLGGTVVPGADTIQTKDSEIDSVDCGGQPTGTSDSANVDQFLDLLPFLIGPGICETVTY